MSITPNNTPQQLNNQREQELKQSSNRLSSAALSQTNASVILNNLPPNLQPKGAAKFAIILNKKSNDLKEILIPKIISLASKAGIENIGTSQLKMPDYCLNQTELDKLIASKNQITDQLNNTVKTINGFSKVLTGYSSIVDITKTSIDVLSATRDSLSIGIKLIPTPPGVPGSVVSVLSDLKEATDLLDPKLSSALGAVSSIQLSLSSTNNTLLKIVNLLNTLDSYIKKCSPNANITPLDTSLNELEQFNNQIVENNNNSYNGFNLEIIEVPYSPTVNRRKAVAKNRNGIILISTPLSFTTDTNILIEELKLIINSNNLKAD